MRIDGSEIMYINHHALLQIELAMNRYGARQAKFKYEYDESVISLVDDGSLNLTDSTDSFDDDDSLVSISVIGTSPGRTTLKVQGKGMKRFKHVTT